MFATKLNTLVTFDRSVIRRDWSRMNKRPLGRAGNLVRRIARGSIKRRKKATTYSRPGQPPYSHKEGKTPPFKMIFNMPDRLGTSEVVGMVGFGRRGEPVPGLHEHGGTAVRTVFSQIAPRRKKTRRDARGRFLSAKRKLTEAQLAKIREREARQGMSDRKQKSVTYEPRPFMFPALKKGRSQYPQYWRGALSR